MLLKKELSELRKEIENSVNPLFLFDNDPDGFCSAVILLKNFDKGNALPIKSFPIIDHSLLNKIEDLMPDKIFILDKPFNNLDFFNSMNEKGIQVFVIDHHQIELNSEIEKKAKFFSTYPSSEPTSFICQKVCNNKNTEWISLIGCIYDVFVPDFIQDFQEKYPELIDSSTPSSRIRYTSEIGKITLILSLGLKSSNQTIQNLIELFLESSGPNDILIENEKNKYLHRRFNHLNKIIERNLENAKVYDNFVFLEYSGEYSLSSDISNVLFFKYPSRFIVVCYKKYEAANISLRGEGAKEFTRRIIEKFPDSTGGGHDVACGLKIRYDYFADFKKMVYHEFSV